MKFQITGKQIDIGSALQSHVQDELSEVMEKYSSRPTDANVIFSKSGHLHVCEAIVHLSTGLTVQAKGSDSEIYAAFDSSTEKMEKQLRRYKRRLKDHHKERVDPVEIFSGGSYIIAANDDSEDEPDSIDSMIIAEMEAKVPSVSVGEAVMQMELASAPVLVFQNETHGGINVVYRRDDGNIGWIEPRSAT